MEDRLEEEERRLQVHPNFSVQPLILVILLSLLYSSVQ
jgi:hypothetical protein